MDAEWHGYMAQVRERYIAGELPLDLFVVDLGVAALLDEGLLLADQADIPVYLVDRFGLPIVAT